ncbi:hypothetical protein PybrP1_006241 [[Pythium] brassicae (nom. inval.)]|nr:hypothetical protein PybrP1_006241 [[Pythium] brassicae (nom. inval.)]
MDDDFLEELIGVSAATIAESRDERHVVLADVFLAAERAVLETRSADVATALVTLQRRADNEPPVARAAESALEMAALLCEGQYADIVRSERGLRLLEALAQRVSGSVGAASSGDSAEQHVCTAVACALEQELLQVEEDADSRVGAAYEVLFVGVALFNMYVQANYTGPAFEPEQLRDINALAARFFDAGASDCSNDAAEKKLHSDALVALQVDGESPFSICEYPQFLLLGRCLLHVVGNATHRNWSFAVGEAGTDSAAQDVFSSPSVGAELLALFGKLHSASWWNARAAVAHERLLLTKESSNTLWFEARRGFSRAIRHAALFDCPASEYLRARLEVEWGLAQHHFAKNRQGKRSFERAKELSGVSAQLSGSMGKRTKFQQKSTAQMVLLAASKHPPTDGAPSVYATAAAASTHADFGGKQAEEEEPVQAAPAAVGDDGLTDAERELQRLVQDGAASYRDISLDQVDQDNILHEHIAFEDASLTAQGNLQVVDQVILLALCLDVKNSNANDGLTREEMFPYITRVLENPNNWMVYSTGLLERAWLECETSKRRERAILQMQALVDQHTTRLTITQNSLAAIADAAPARERMAFVHALAFPPRYVLKRDLAERYLAIGVVQSALEIFEELEMWDDVVKCYQILDKPLRAEKLIRARLAVAPTPYMWCCLGDVTHEPAHYETSWALSKHRFARAKRSLGRHCFEAGEYEAAIAHYQESVEVNPMNTSAWFVMGTMGMRRERWELALRAFTRVAQLDPENGEAWGNIGSIHMHTGRYLEAFAVLQEALKQKRHMWQMWENYAVCAMETDKYGEAIYALHQHLDLREKHHRPVDHEVLAWLVEAIAYPDKYDQLVEDLRDASISDDAQGGADDALAAAVAGHDEENEDADADDDDDLGDLDEAAVATDRTPPRSNFNLKKQLALLFGRITSITTNNAKVWQIYAHFNDGLGRAEKALDCRLKQCRALQRAGWEQDEAAVRELCKAAARLSEDYVREGSKKSLYACRLYLRGVLKKAQVDYAALEEVHELAATLERVNGIEAQR